MRLLVAEDEPGLLNITVKRLKAEGYAVDGCADGEEASYYLKAAQYDLAILDIMMPKKDGVTVLSELRAAKTTTPVLLLTALDSVEDRVRGLDAGADDYLVKPFAFDELLARVRALLRRGPDGREALATLVLGDLVMDTASRTVSRAGKPIALTLREFAVLEYLFKNKGVVVSRGRLESHVWDYGFEGSSNIVDVYVRYLRKKVDDPFDKKLIHTVRGVGYIMKEDG